MLCAGAETPMRRHISIPLPVQRATNGNYPEIPDNSPNGISIHAPHTGSDSDLFRKAAKMVVRQSTLASGGSGTCSIKSPGWQDRTVQILSSASTGTRLIVPRLIFDIVS